MEGDAILHLLKELHAQESFALEGLEKENETLRSLMEQTEAALARQTECKGAALAAQGLAVEQEKSRAALLELIKEKEQLLSEDASMQALAEAVLIEKKALPKYERLQKAEEAYAALAAERALAMKKNEAATSACLSQAEQVEKTEKRITEGTKAAEEHRRCEKELEGGVHTFGGDQAREQEKRIHREQNEGQKNAGAKFFQSASPLFR